MKHLILRVVCSCTVIVAAFCVSGCNGVQSDGPSATQDSDSEKSVSPDGAPTGSDSSNGGPPSQSQRANPKTATDFFELAKRRQDAKEHDSAFEAITKSLILEPENDAARFLSARIEADRGNFENALEIANSIGPPSELANASTELRYKILSTQGRHSQAADVILTALDQGREVTQWRHDAWQLLNYVGRREEASEQALALCRSGLADQNELLSLINRTLSFPTPRMLKDDQKSEGYRFFSSGLGRARWYFTTGEFAAAMKELESEIESEFSCPAAEALYGRLLSENQQWEKLVQWNANVSEPTKSLGDYWAAIGTFFAEKKRHEAAARSLMEALRRNPTDRICIQRLSRVFFAMGRDDDAKQFRYRGVDLVKTETEAEVLYQAPTNTESRKRLARALMEIQRPFETLAWTMSLIPVNATQPRQAIEQQRADLLSDPSAITMASEATMLDLDPEKFDMSSAWKELFTGSASRVAVEAPKRREILATPRLVNRAKETGLDFQWYKDVEIDLVSIPIHESLGGGIAAFDFDLDGWTDVYLAQGSGDPPTDRCTRSSELFRNTETRFQSVTLNAGASDTNYSSGLAAGDVNQDGFPDLFLGSLGHNRLLINNGDGTFRDATVGMGDIVDRFTSSIGIGDINDDGLPDLFEANYIEMEGGFALPRRDDSGNLVAPTPLSHYADSDRWFENLGNGDFKVHDITREIATPGTSLGVVITDFDSDGKNEVFVGIDVRPNHYFVQRGSNTLVNIANSNGLANGLDGVANGCMGIATGDFNRDGKIDMQIANYSLEPANLFLQESPGAFSDLSRRYGLAEPTHHNVGFGTKAVDLDHNGYLDFIVSNGHIFDLRSVGEPYQMAPQVLMSDGEGYGVVEVDDDSGYWNDNYLGRSVTMLDYDRDGATDFIIGHLDKPVALLHNETKFDGSWLQLELVGTETERDAIGAKVELVLGNTRLTEWVTGGDGYFSSDEPIVNFALSGSETPQSLVVHWPSGGVETFSEIQTKRRLLVVEGTQELWERSGLAE